MRPILWIAFNWNADGLLVEVVRCDARDRLPEHLPGVHLQL